MIIGMATAIRVGMKRYMGRCLSEVVRQEETQRLLLVQPRSTSDRQLHEACRLAETHSGRECRVLMLGRRRGFIPSGATFLGSGSVEMLKSEMSGAKEIFINAILTSIQVRNLESVLGIRVLDRIGMIVSIFAQRARSREAKLQVELACLQLARTRLVRVIDATGRPATFGVDGASQVVSARERHRGGGGQGGLGGGGQGEKEIVLQRSRIQQQIRKLKNQIENVKKTRNVQRQGRQRNGIPIVAVVGYTNAGKSTLVSKLTKSDLECDDLYFKTLDPISRRLDIPGNQVEFCLVSDTVGFISDLPICLFAAFRATLEEASHADCILHVIDANADTMDQQRREVYKVTIQSAVQLSWVMTQTLRQIGVHEDTLKHKTIEAFNKMDKLEERHGTALYLSRSITGQLSLTTSRRHLMFTQWLERIEIEEPGFRPGQIFISALNGDGLLELKQMLGQIIQTPNRKQ